MFEAKHPAGATQPGLNLVADKQCAVLPAKLLRPGEEIVAWIVYSLALHRLDDEGGDSQ